MINSRRTAISFILLSLSLVALQGCQKKIVRYSKKRNTVRAYSQLNDTTLLLTGVSSNPVFGKSESSPVMLGMYEIDKAATNVEKYLNALTGPQGEAITYKRLKPCCPFKTKNFILNYTFLPTEFNGKYGMLEKYSISYDDKHEIKSTILYFNLYDETKELLAPQGFYYKKDE